MSSSYDNFAREYSDSMGDEGDYFHKTQIDPYIYKIIGNPNGKVIYDLGCGNGYMSRYFSKHGAKVYASDSSEELIRLATQKSSGLDITYSLHDALSFDSFSDEMFDVVVMNMMVHYIEDLNKLFEGVSKKLKRDGLVVFSTNHFFRPPYPYSEWITGKVGGSEKLFIKVTNYLETYRVDTLSLWDNKTKLTIFNRPLNVFMSSLSKSGLLMKEIYEPESVGFAKGFSEELQKSHHIPTFVICGAKKA